VSTGIAESLSHSGMSPVEAQRKAVLFAAAERALAASAEPLRWHVPGRIEVLGKHTDYAGGRSLLCAAERGLCVVAMPRSDSLIRITDAVSGQSTSFEFAVDLTIPSEGWTIFPKTVARRMARNFGGKLSGAEIGFASDLPRAAGMSSSSALIVAVFTVLSAVNHVSQHQQYLANIRSREDLAGYLGCIENGQSFGSLAGDRGVGTFGGSEDHTAIFCARPRCLMLYSFCPVQFERDVELPSDCTFVIGVSGVRADKTGATREQYNRASRSAQAILSAWRSNTGVDTKTLAAASTSSADAPQRIRSILRNSQAEGFDSACLLHRFEQFYLESETIIPKAVDALRVADLVAFGKLVEQSQQAAEQLLGNQVPETIALAGTARSLGAYAASAFGAGFGGSVWALASCAEADAFSKAWKADYEARFPQAAGESQFFITAAGPPVTQL
jgi:galactokinase